MAVARVLKRLLRIRDLEEEQSRNALESALGNLHRLQNVQAATIERDRRGRHLVLSSANSGELPDRLAGLEETHSSKRIALALAPRIAHAQKNVTQLREEYLAKRVERRQAETLIEEAQARDAIDTGRRSQQALDDWFLNRLHRERLKASRVAAASSAIALPVAALKETKSDGRKADGRET
jgi:flagellar biosynthesis chaperone FliJ